MVVDVVSGILSVNPRVSVEPGLVKAIWKPGALTKFAPSMVTGTSTCVVPPTPVLGVIDVITGEVGSVTVKAPGRVPDWPSGFVITTSQAPAVIFAGIANLHVISVGD